MAAIATANKEHNISSTSTQSSKVGVSKNYLDRFHALKQRREAVSKGSTARRVNDIKTSLVETIRQSFKNDDELEALKQNCVDIDGLAAIAEAERHNRKKTFKHQSKQ